MVEQEELQQILEDQRNKYKDERIARNFKGWNKTMQYHFTDTDEYYIIKFVDGDPLPAEKIETPLEKPDISYDMDTETLKAMNENRISGMQAFQQKRLSVKASMSDMRKLQSLNRI